MVFRKAFEASKIKSVVIDISGIFRYENFTEYFPK